MDTLCTCARKPSSSSSSQRKLVSCMNPSQRREMFTCGESHGAQQRDLDLITQVRLRQRSVLPTLRLCGVSGPHYWGTVFCTSQWTAGYSAQRNEQRYITRKIR